MTTMALIVAATLPAATLGEQLRQESPVSLARAAGRHGDAERGAIVFYQPYMACRSCHPIGGDNPLLGPDLASWEQPIADTDLVQAVLEPSAKIRKGYAARTLITRDGQNAIGLLAKETDHTITLVDPIEPARRMTFSRDDIDRVVVSPRSMMPDGLVNQLSSRQQFLDLIRYLMALRDGGVPAARRLEPAPHLYTAPPLPDYEQHIDHAGMIAALDSSSYERGKAIYDRLCVNCHGTVERPGSLPTSLRFARDKFSNGSDPYTMYQTLTRGFGMMQPQAWMVPQQKYDVIHYIREAYLKPHNPSQYFAVTRSWLNTLPKGDTFGPEPQRLEPWITMDYGTTLVHTYQTPGESLNFAYKGIATRLDPGPGGISQGRHWMVFDHDTLRMAAAWSKTGPSSDDQFISWTGIQFNGQHGVHPMVAGRVAAATPNGPGWADPSSGSWDDNRIVGRDGRRYGPLPRDWGHYQGMYYCDDATVVSYRVGEADILEQPLLLAQQPSPIFARRLSIESRDQPLELQLSEVSQRATDVKKLDAGPSRSVHNIVVPTRYGSGFLIAGIVPQSPTNIRWRLEDQRLRLRIPPGPVLRLTIWFTRIKNQPEAFAVLDTISSVTLPEKRLQAYTQGGHRRWPETVETTPVINSNQPDATAPFAVDVLTRPATNPWHARVRLTGFDFFADGDSAAVCTWDGDIWRVSGIDRLDNNLKWQRIASGLFQPLGLKIIDGDIYVTCRDQIVILRDLNGDGETDFYENFNNDHQVTEHFHEFAMGLQTDEAGNLYYAKSARHALPAVVPHHGTLLRVTPDGKQTKIVANGFRAANGVCLNPDGTFIVTDQEGHWTPKNRINWVREGGFYGNMLGYHDVTDESDDAMERPVCWITNEFDRSPAELLWVPRDTWGPLGGKLLNLSYGYGKVYVVPHEHIGEQVQGGLCALPIGQRPTGLIRGRFHPHNGHLYTCGMFAWAGDQQQPGGFYRVRRTGQPMYLPVGLHATTNGVQIQWSDPIDRSAARDSDHYQVTVWDLERTERYGSEHHNRRHWEVTKSTLSADGKLLTLTIPEIAPTRGMEILVVLQTPDGRLIRRRIHNTIHTLQRDSSAIK